MVLDEWESSIKKSGGGAGWKKLDGADGERFMEQDGEAGLSMMENAGSEWKNGRSRVETGRWSNMEKAV